MGLEFSSSLIFTSLLLLILGGNVIYEELGRVGFVDHLISHLEFAVLEGCRLLPIRKLRLVTLQLTKLKTTKGGKPG
jgi:hypothetical protein